MHRPAFATLMLALLSACASPPAEPVPAPADEPSRATLEVIGHHCDGGQGIDGLAVHVDKPGVAVIRWSNKNVCGDPS